MKFKQFLETQELDESLRRRADQVVRRSKWNNIDLQQFESVFSNHLLKETNFLENPIRKLEHITSDKISISLTPGRVSRPGVEDMNIFPITKGPVERALQKTERKLGIKFNIMKFQEGKVGRSVRNTLVVVSFQNK